MIFDKLLSDPEIIAKKVFNSISKQKSLVLTYFNQHCFNIYIENQDYRDLIDNKFTAYQADLGVYLAKRFLNHIAARRIESTAMNEKLLGEIINKNIPIVIIGGDFEETFVAEEAKKKGINLASYIKGFFNLDQMDEIVNSLSNRNMQVFFIGMGVPKQESFANILAKKFPNKVIICVGIFFEYYFGTIKRAPQFFQKFGIEWLFRLLYEPRRLWRRYVIGIPKFIIRVLKIKFSR
jgi:exopolysaccharide biosynthesis WecB/TagA/CpsF family protein